LLNLPVSFCDTGAFEFEMNTIKITKKKEWHIEKKEYEITLPEKIPVQKSDPKNNLTFAIAGI
jgi:hypothetical protein